MDSGGSMGSIHEMDTAEFRIPVLGESLVSPIPPSSRVQVEFGAVTHRGNVRDQNEDSFIVYRVGRYWEKLATSLPPQELPDRFEEFAYAMAVADGIGGQSGGEVASKLAIRVIVNLVINSHRWALRLDNPETRDEEIAAAKKRVEDYFHRVDAALTEHADRYPRLAGMGTTMTGAYTSSHDLFTIHVGDSRAYLFRGGKLNQLTHDQTLAQQLADTGAISPEEAAHHYLRHTLTSCLGGQNGRVAVDVRLWHLLEGDRVLLCSDGLTEMVSEAQIAQVLSTTPGSQPACETLLNLALHQGGKDNVTVLLAKYHWPEDK